MRPTKNQTTKQRGFTLLEVLFALAILTLASFAVLGMRTDAIKDAVRSRDWLVAREKAQALLAELTAGHREVAPSRSPERLRFREERFKDWYYMIVRGEDQISEIESQAESAGAGDDDARDQAERRRQWQNERDNLRGSKQAGVSYLEYTDQEYRKENGLSDETDEEEAPPSEDELIDVGVFVFFPNVNAVDDETERSFFALKAKISTMAWEGFTPDEADARAQAMGEPAGGSGSGSANPLGGMGR